MTLWMQSVDWKHDQLKRAVPRLFGSFVVVGGVEVGLYFAARVRLHRNARTSRFA